MNIGVVIVSNNRNPEMLMHAHNSAMLHTSEVVLVDNGSEYPIDFADHRVWNNLPLDEAYNYGVSKLETEWVCLIGDDDLILPQMREIICGWSDPSVIVSPVQLFGDREMQLWGTIAPEVIEQENHIPSSSLFRRDLWEKLDGFQAGVFFDWNFWIRAWKAGASFAWNHQPVVMQRCWPGQTSRQMSVADTLMAIEQATGQVPWHVLQSVISHQSTNAEVQI